MIVVIGILFAVLISRVDFASDDAKATGAMTDLRSFQTAAHAIALKHNGFDSDLETLANQLNTKLDAELQLSVSGNKLVSAATDPWGTPYEVTVAGNTLMAASAGKNTSFKSTDDVLTKVQCVTSADGFDVVVSNHPDLTGINFASLESASWADISEVSASGLAAYVYSIGDTKVVNSSWTVQIADFDHDDLADGSGKAGITFTTLMSTFTHEFNSDGDDVGDHGGWEQSDIRTYLNSGSFYTGLPTALKSEIKSVIKVSDDGNVLSGLNAASLIITTDKIWLLSAEELSYSQSFINENYYVCGQGTAYTLYIDDYSRIVTNDVDPQYYLTRSSDFGTMMQYDAYFFVNSDGVIEYNNDCESCVAPGFCI